MIFDLPAEVSGFLENLAGGIERIVIETKKDIYCVRRESKVLFRQCVIPYYEEAGISANPSIYNLMLEPLKNSVFHADSDTGISAELMLSRKALVFGVNDHGGYFMRPGIKEWWEGKRAFSYSQRHKTEDERVGYGAGSRIIYEMADIIHVDDRCGTLYLGTHVPGRCLPDK